MLQQIREEGVSFVWQRVSDSVALAARLALRHVSEKVNIERGLDNIDMDENIIQVFVKCQECASKMFDMALDRKGMQNLHVG